MLSPSIATADEDQQHDCTAAALESKIVNKEFCLNSKPAPPKSLNVTCYGSSSSKTPSRYLDEARLLGYILAKRGHVCINGAGSYGCMAAMNDGVFAGEGHVRGVIHEMFLADNGYFDIDKKTSRKLMRRGSSHRVFENAIILSKDEHEKNNNNRNAGGDNDNDNDDDNTKLTPIREILVAGGNDLQERKKFLVTNTDALIVMPGGPGTWDELWEMACARHLNLNTLPIVCVNVDGYYEPFREMLNRAYADELIRLPPHEIVQFASSAEDAIRFVEGEMVEEIVSSHVDNNKLYAKKKGESPWCNLNLALTFVAGAAFGVVIATSIVRRQGR